MSPQLAGYMLPKVVLFRLGLAAPLLCLVVTIVVLSLLCLVVIFGFN
jgi:hypothetical protein